MICRRVWAGVVVLLGLQVACGAPASQLRVPDGAAGSGATKAVASEAEGLSPVERSEQDELASSRTGVPSECHGGEVGACVPDPAWVDRLCEGVFSGVALVMFRAGSPWQRLYLTRKVEAANASGGVTVAGELQRGEEVLVLRRRAAQPGGIVVGGGDGQYDALRYNGSCVSLDGGEVSARRPARPGHSRVEWRWLGEDVRAALRKSEDITSTYRARRKECRGATRGAVSRKCQRLDEELVSLIVAEVRAGLQLPEPRDQP